MKTIAEADVMSGRMDAHLFQTSPTYKEEWERCKKKFEQDAYYIKLREKLKFEKFRTEFERKYA